MQARLPEGEELEATTTTPSFTKKWICWRSTAHLPRARLTKDFPREKKRCEILQMAMLDPRYAVLDETTAAWILTP